MRDLKEYSATVKYIERLKNSRNGNPKFMVVFEHDGGVFSAVTKTDCSLAFNIGRHLGKPVTVEIGEHYNRATISQIFA
jgi:hypothetical protein